AADRLRVPAAVVGDVALDRQRAAAGGREHDQTVIEDGVAAGIQRQRLGADIGIDRRGGDVAVLQLQALDQPVARDGVAVVVEDVAARPGGSAARGGGTAA